MDFPIEIFKSGVNNLYSDEIIPDDAASDSLGFITLNGRIMLIGGRQLLGADSGVTGQIRGLWFGNTVTGTQVLYRKTETTIDYFKISTSAWVTIIQNLTTGSEAYFANYASIAGGFTFISSIDGLWKINNACPANPVNMFNPQVNFKGRLMIDKGRMFMWNTLTGDSKDTTTLRGSHQDSQQVPYYTQVTNEVEQTGDGTTKVFSGTLKTVPSLSFINQLSMWAPTGASLTVTAITRDIQAQITTSTAHGLSAGDSVVFNGVKSGVPLSGTGTVTISGNYAVTGSGTSFTTQLKVGARIFINATATVYAPASTGGQYTYPTTVTGIVQNIASDTSLTVQLPFNLQWGSGPVTIVTASASNFTYSSMSQLTNVPALVTSIVDADNFVIDVDSRNFDVYSSGDTVNQAEVLNDNYDGTLSALSGATGTVNYATGAYSISLKNAVANSQNLVATYNYENSNNGGLTDFTFSQPRVGGEGFSLPQDFGGDPIEKVVLGLDGAYYSMKQQTAYRFAIDTATDTQVTNEIYYHNMGIPSANAVVSTDKGILFINTSNVSKPEMTVLVKNQVNNTLVPEVLFTGFNFALYDFSDAYFDTYERYVLVSCKTKGQLQNNRILLCNIADSTVDISPYEARMFAKDVNENLYVGSPLTQNVYNIYSGFDDLGNSINAYWSGSGQQYGNLHMRSAKWRFIREVLKKFRKFNIKGLISLDQTVQVWISYDDSPFFQIGTVSGRGTYVDAGNSETIGSNFIGSLPVGGSGAGNVYPYFCQITLSKMPKFRKRKIKLIPTGIGYFDVNFMSDFDLMLFEDRLPARYRSKQKVSLTGVPNQPDSLT